MAREPDIGSGERRIAAGARANSIGRQGDSATVYSAGAITIGARCLAKHIARKRQRNLERAAARRAAHAGLCWADELSPSLGLLDARVICLDELLATRGDLAALKRLKFFAGLKP
jgi:hypothetical protein